MPQELLEVPDGHPGQFSGFAERQFVLIEQVKGQLSAQFVLRHPCGMEYLFRDFERNGRRHDRNRQDEENAPDASEKLGSVRIAP
jgi:hypothetical protein